jgi:pimeloyl-ACP methyl ester carboxylesterase
MPVMEVRGVNLSYQVIGEQGPWVALMTGGRRSHREFVPLAGKIAAVGYRVLLHDRRNTGASDILIEGEESEETIWADDLRELLARLDAVPAYVGGASSGARTSLLMSLRHAKAVRGLLLMRITGGAFAAKRLPENYYGQFVRAAESGGMAAVCATEAYRERLAANPRNRTYLMNLDPAQFIAVMSNWRALFERGAHYPVMGASPEELGSVRIPAIVIPGNDRVHSSESGRAAQRLIPDSKLHQLPLSDQDVPLIPFEEWGPHEAEIATTFVAFMRGIDAGASN